MEDAPDDLLEVKRWLRRLRDEADLTQEELGQIVGLTGKAVANAESLRKPSLPHGWSLYLMLRELGVLTGAPDPSRPTVADRLGALEAAVTSRSDSVAMSLDALARDIRALERRRDRGDDAADEAAR
jgi:transcriptional regulator with XRE-family HTH domain